MSKYAIRPSRSRRMRANLDRAADRFGAIYKARRAEPTSARPMKNRRRKLSKLGTGLIPVALAQRRAVYFTMAR